MVHAIFMFFAAFKNLKSLFSAEKMPVHALDVFIENTPQKWFELSQ